MTFPNCTLSILFLLSLTLSKSVSDSIIDENLFRQSVFYGLSATATKEDGNTPCRVQLAATVDGISDRKIWAMKMFDSSGVPSSGFNMGGSFWAGSRRQCDTISFPKNISINTRLGPVTLETEDSLPPFPVVYFTAVFEHNSTFSVITRRKNEYKIVLGLCLPKSCSENEIIDLLQKYFDKKVLYHQHLYNTSYQVEEVKKMDGNMSWLWNIHSIISCLILLTYLSLCIIGTWCDYKYHQPKSKNDNVISSTSKVSKETSKFEESKMTNLSTSYKIILGFSVFTSNKTVFNTNINNNSILCIYGLKSCSLFLIIINHALVFFDDYMENVTFMFYDADNVSAKFMFIVLYSVETFYCSSAYILAYSFFKNEYDKRTREVRNLKENIIFYLSGFLKRLIRLTPSYVAMLGLTIIITKWQYENSLYLPKQRNDLTCPNYWWRNLLYIHNLFPESEMCMDWCWFISVEMQMYTVIYFLLILSTVYFYSAVFLLTTILFGSIIYTANLVYTLGFSFYIDEIQYTMELLYFNPLIRLPCYIVGIYAAYVTYYFKKSLPIKKTIVNFLWIFCGCLLVLIVSGFFFVSSNVHISAIYMALGRFSWGIMISWVIIACETGNGGKLNKFLCHKIWLSISQIIYMAQMVNPLVIYIIAIYMEKPYQFQAIVNITMAFGLVVLILITSYILTILIELPSNSTFKIINSDIIQRKSPSIKKQQ